MTNILIVSSAEGSLAELFYFLEEQPTLDLSRAGSGAGALEAVKADRFDLVIIDEDLGDMTGMEFARLLVSADPMTNSALVSSLTEDDFHEASEGLGILAKLPLQPSADKGRELLDQLEGILQITGTRKR